MKEPTELMQWVEVSKVVERLAAAASVPHARTSLIQAIHERQSDEDEAMQMLRAAHSIRLRLGMVHWGARDVYRTVSEGFPVAWHNTRNDEWWVFETLTGAAVKGVRIAGESMKEIELTFRQFQAILRQNNLVRFENAYVAQPFLDCDSASAFSAHPTHSGHNTLHHEALQITPWRRLLKLISMDWQDIASLVIYGLSAGILGLATPLAAEWVVTTIAFARYLQPLIVLAFMLLTFLLFAGAMQVLQAMVVEILQRRLMIRLVGDLAYRLPHVHPDSLHGQHAPELLNRFLDVATIQKAVASLLLDGIGIVLSTLIGMVLLAVYHPYLLGFDLVLLICMTWITFLLGRGGIRTATKESLNKFQITHLLQDVISYPTAFRLHGGWLHSIDRANRLTVEYLTNRRSHFLILLRQVLFSVFLQAAAMTALLGIGGWLVILGQLTLGQLVASELVIAVIVGAFAKIGKSLETFYDLMASVNKVGHLLDLEPDPPATSIHPGTGPAMVRWLDVRTQSGTGSSSDFGSGQIEAGQRVEIAGDDSLASDFVQFLAGLKVSDSGFLEIDGVDARDASRYGSGRFVGVASKVEIFHGTIHENICLGRHFVTTQNVRQALDLIGLSEDISHLPSGLETMLQTGGGPLSLDQRIRLMIARAIVAMPRLLLIDHLLDQLSESQCRSIADRLTDPNRPWTLIVATHHAVLGNSAQRFVFTSTQ